MNPAIKTFDLIHYGTDHFDFTRFQPVTDRKWIKPKGGLWTSPVDSGWGWRQWCEAEEWGLEGLQKSIRLSFTGMTITIDCEADLAHLPWVGDASHPMLQGISFERMFLDGVEAMHLTERGQERTRWSMPRSLYGWDCETVLILNPAGITIHGQPGEPPKVKPRRRILNAYPLPNTP